MVEPVQITDYKARIQETDLQQFKDKPNFEAIIEVVATQFNELEDALFQVIEDTRLSTAEGVQLDQLGQELGQVRPDGFSDTDYRDFLTDVQTLINSSSGTPEQMLAILDALMSTVIDLVLIERYPACATIEIRDAINPPGTFPDATDIYGTLQAAKPAAVSLLLVSVPASPFGFFGDPEAVGFNTGNISGAVTPTY